MHKPFYFSNKSRNQTIFQFFLEHQDSKFLADLATKRTLAWPQKKEKKKIVLVGNLQKYLISPLKKKKRDAEFMCKTFVSHGVKLTILWQYNRFDAPYVSCVFMNCSVTAKLE